ncbi:sigma-54 interaction domain-containing protein [Pseudorhodoplanes sp.]|uniref:sigma-54 interaction domain-containing protein n=1 Tax=Pseudorhodoplanes sp. TaxID=1934341 RepID=UPI002B82DD7D|nr:sigma 54-interacting transcriptional regulator [Pseudorhodoplanes sp.]HWV55424.1 sigma 54-interacting transcriptional regulator [Pseudorhodoplanes sp.]
MTDTRNIAGLIVVDAAGKVVFSVGRGTDPRIVALVEDKTWREDAIRRRMVPIQTETKSVFLWSQVNTYHFAAIVDGLMDSVFEFAAAVDFAWDIIHHLLTDPFNAMTVVDADGKVAFLSPVHEGFFGLDHGAAIGRPVRDVIENTRLDHVARTGKAEVGDVQRMRGQDRVVNRSPIFREGKLVGAIGRVMFKNPEQVQALNQRVNALEKELEFYRREAHVLRREAFDLDTIVGRSKAIQRLKEDIVRIAPLDISVLVLGESGTGKELVAHAIHRLSPRQKQKMVIVNSAALPSNLVESELFGYEPGSFTGADRKGRRGKFEQAHGSSLFLDEIGDMPLDIQAKLLRVLQDRVIQRVGGEGTQEVDFRLIAATNRDLRNLVSNENFRLDFYYRISPIVLTVPPLRERLDDIPVLIEKFLTEFGSRHQLAIPEIDDDVYGYLARQEWPGNIRQLRHVVERAVIFCSDNRLRIADFQSPALMQAAPTAAPEQMQVGNLQGALDRVEGDIIRDALARHKGNKKKVAEELGISRSYLYKKLGVS